MNLFKDIWNRWSTRSRNGKPVTLRDLNEMETRIMSKQNELAAGLNTVRDQLAKANTEIQGKITALEEALKNQEDVSPELQAAFDALKPAAQVLDDIVPDATEPSPEPTV